MFLIITSLIWEILEKNRKCFETFILLQKIKTRGATRSQSVLQVMSPIFDILLLYRVSFINNKYSNDCILNEIAIDLILNICQLITWQPHLFSTTPPLKEIESCHKLKFSDFYIQLIFNLILALDFWSDRIYSL